MSVSYHTVLKSSPKKKLYQPPEYMGLAFIVMLAVTALFLFFSGR